MPFIVFRVLLFMGIDLRSRETIRVPATGLPLLGFHLLMVSTPANHKGLRPCAHLALQQPGTRSSCHCDPWTSTSGGGQSVARSTNHLKVFRLLLPFLF